MALVVRRYKSAKAILRHAADLLEREGWVQGEFGDMTSAKGPHCAMGATAVVADDGAGSNADDLLRDFVGINISAWNDAAGQTAANVIATMRRAAA